MVFQIVDDVLDLTATAEQLGKPAGHDMEEGVYTFPVLRTLTTGRESADELRALLGKPLDPAERDKALAIVRSDDGIESAIVAARAHVDAAVEACDALGRQCRSRGAARGSRRTARDGAEQHHRLTRVDRDQRWDRCAGRRRDERPHLPLVATPLIVQAGPLCMS